MKITAIDIAVVDVPYIAPVRALGGGTDLRVAGPLPPVEQGL